MTVNINKPQINLREQLKKLERPTTDRLVVKGSDGVLIDKLTGELSIQAIDAAAGGTAVDVFIYDTSKDSDGGAWRKRTQHTSWYNETLNTATRGSRREFPAVAVIVATSSKVTIYDGDDPDLPMWMVFTSNVNQYGAIYNNRSVVSIVAINGSVIWADNVDSVIDVSFIKDNYTSTASSGSWNSSRNILDRNPTDTNNLWTNYDSGRRLVAYPLNDIAMTVLPNAPIDSATGLPIPTIAVATNGGVSVIKDDGTVVDKATTSDPSYRVDWMSPSRLLMTAPLYYGIFDDPFTEESGGYVSNISNSSYYNGDGDGSSWNYPRPIANLSSSSEVIATDSRTIIAATNSGLNIHELSTSSGTDNNDGIVAYATTSYNTGWIHGDIKGAFLSDTDATNVTSSNLMSGATYSSSERITSYSYTAGSDTLVIDDDEATVDGYVVLTLGGLSPSTTYVVSYTTDNTYTSTAGYNPHIGNTAIGTAYFDASQTGSGQGSLQFTTASSGDPTLVLYSGYSGGDLTFTINLRLAELDRSVNNKGLQVFGTVTKSPVATGAELVAYGPFSSSDYLKQPIVSSPGTGDFSVSFWIKPGTLGSGTGNYFHLFDLGNSSSGGQGSSTGFTIKMYAVSAGSSFGYVPYFYSGDGGDKGTYDTNIVYNLGVWTHAVWMRKGGIPLHYMNGKLVKTGTSWTSNLTDSLLLIGRPGPSYAEFGGDALVSLLRYSTTVPSSEQIKKIYEDEKVLFQENAACTLYGSSDAVTALAYDTTTESLHVGTSSGRSEFKGLRRVSNTTTGVTTAISASNGLIAEQ